MANKNTVLSIIVDAKNNAEKALGEVSKNLDAISTANENLINTAKTVGKVGAAAFAALSGAVGFSIYKTEELGSTLSDMSKRTGLSVEALSKLKYAAEQSGASLQSLEVATKAMSKFVDGARDSADSAETTFGKLGIKIQDLDKLSPDQLFMKLAKAVSEIRDPIQRASVAMDVFGKAGTDLLPLLDEGPDGLKRLGDEAERLGVVMTKEQADTWERFGDALGRIKNAVTGIQIAIASSLLPTLEKMQPKIEGVVTGLGDWARQNPQLIATLIIVGLVLSGILAVLLPISLALPAIVISFKALSAIFTFFVSGPGFAVVAILGLIALTMYNVYQSILILRENWDDVWLGMKITVAEWANAVTGIFETVVNYIIDGINFVIKAINKLTSQLARIPIIGKSLSSTLTLSTIGQQSFGRIDVDSLISSDLSARKGGGTTVVNITGNTLLDKNSAEKIGDLMMQQLKLSNPI